MKAEELIALETALRDLARLYESASLFTSLRPRAELDLLPRLNELGAQLRSQLRHHALAPSVMQHAVVEIHRLTADWQHAIAAIRTAPTFTRAVAAFDRDDQGTLRSLLPRILAGLVPNSSAPPVLYFGVPLTVPHPQRVAAHRFLPPAEAAAKIAAYGNGIEPDSGHDWWDQLLRFVALVDDVALADSPVALAITLDAARYSLFTSPDEVTWRVYTPCLRSPVNVILASEPRDDWWETTTEPYALFRERLATLLRARQIAVTCVD